MNNKRKKNTNKKKEVLSSHQRGKNKKTPKTKTKKIVKFKCNTLAVSPSASSPSSVILSSKEEKNTTKQRVWRQLSECLSEAGVYLPPTANHMLLQALIFYLFIFLNRLKIYFTDLNGYFTFTLVIQT
jgi:hypothetical protein